MLNLMTLSCTIDNGGSLSSVAQPASAPMASLSDMAVYAILMPAAWTAANLTIQVSNDGTNYYNVYDAAGLEVVIIPDASRYILIPPSAFICGKFIKLRSGTAGTPVNQGAERTIQILARYFD